MGWVTDTLKAYSEFTIFPALAGGFSRGNVTATLLVAMLVSQLNIAVPGQIPLLPPAPLRGNVRLALWGVSLGVGSVGALHVQNQSTQKFAPG